MGPKRMQAGLQAFALPFRRLALAPRHRRCHIVGQVRTGDTMTVMPTQWTWSRLLAAALGVVLILGAVIYAAANFTWPAGARLAPLPLAGIAALVLFNLALSAALWWLIVRSLDADPPVTVGKMWHLTAAIEVLGYLPLAAWGSRAIYLRLWHAVPVRQSILALALALGVTLVAVGVLLVGLLAPEGMQRALAALAALGVVTIVSIPILKRLTPRPAAATWLWLPLKGLDLAVHGARLSLAMLVLDHAIDPMQAMLAAAAGVVVRLARLTPAGLGLREWAIGLAVVQTAGLPAALALTAALVDRAVETVIVLAVGLPAMVKLRRPPPPASAVQAAPAEQQAQDAAAPPMSER